MGKSFYTAAIFSLFFCLPVFGGESFGEESFSVQESSEQTGDFSAAEQAGNLYALKQDQPDNPQNIREEEERLSAVVQALDEIASAVAVKKSEETSSISFTQEMQSISIAQSVSAGKSYKEVEKAAKISASEPAVQPEQPTAPANRWGISLTPEEFNLLSRIVMLEAGGESPLGQQAVTEVIFNRMVSPYYGGSLEHVLSSKGQFSTWKHRYSAHAAPTPQVIASVTAVLQGETNILPFQTLYFSRKPQNSRIQIRIGRHSFCNQ